MSLHSTVHITQLNGTFFAHVSISIILFYAFKNISNNIKNTDVIKYNLLKIYILISKKIFFKYNLLKYLHLNHLNLSLSKPLHFLPTNEHSVLSEGHILTDLAIR